MPPTLLRCFMIWATRPDCPDFWRIDQIQFALGSSGVAALRSMAFLARVRANPSTRAFRAALDRHNSLVDC